MAKATHNGTCQVCGNVQAVKASGKLAKHGYTTEYGFFNGTCQGSDKAPLENSTDCLDKTVGELNNEAIRIRGLEASSIEKVLLRMPRASVWVQGAQSYFTEDNFNEADLRGLPKEWNELQVRELNRLNRMVDQLVAHSALLLRLKTDRFGQSLYKRGA